MPVILSCFLAVFVLKENVYAAGWAEVLNGFETGIVDIEITEYQEIDGNEILWEDDQEIMPGKVISKIPRIRNNGCECYIRAGIQPSEYDSGLEEYIFGMSSQWIKAEDGYFYYQEPLKKDMEVELFKGVKIPENFSQDYEGAELHLAINVDAIQSKNFVPDFAADSPWGTVTIVKSKSNGDYTIASYQNIERQTLKVEYQGESGSLITNENDFFVNFPVLMPGDEYSDSAVLENDGEKDMDLYFCTEILEESPLLDEIMLEITVAVKGESRKVYQGNIRAEELSSGQILCVLPPGSTGNLGFRISVPEEMDNRYADLESCVKWVFTTEEKKTVPTITPKTGDFGNEIVMPAGIMILSGAAIAVILWKKIRYPSEHGGKDGNL